METIYIKNTKTKHLYKLYKLTIFYSYRVVELIISVIV